MLEKFLPRVDFSSYEDFKRNYQVNIPADFNFAYDIVDGWAKEQPAKTALVWCDDHGGKRSFTFSDIAALSARTANYLRSLGIGKGDVVLLILRRRWEYWVAANAVHKLGAVLIPGSLQLTQKDIAYRANAAGIKAIIAVDDPFVVEQVELAQPKAPSLAVKILVGQKKDGWESFEKIDEFPDQIERVQNDVKDTFLIYFTSGTTGMPKMVRHDFSYPLGHIVTAKYWQCVQEDKLHMSVSDSGWAKFGWGKIYGQWICGAVIFAYDMDKFVPKNLLQKIQDYKLTTFCAPPTMYRFMLTEDVSVYDLSSVERWCLAGEPLNPEIFRKWEQLTGKKMAEGFGQSESSVMLANFPWFDPIPGSMGKPSPLYDIALLDADGNPCEDGDEGEIAVMNARSAPPAGLFTGYFHDEENTNKSFQEGVYNLKDVAWRDSEGYYWFVGRHDDVIKCSGYRIGPFEVESALLEHKAVLECAVTAAPDPIRGQVVKATIVLKAGFTGSPELIKELQNHVKKVTAPYKYPRVVEFVAELPKTLGGKIKRAQIRRNDSDGN
ncbi:MAG TPA: AMP-binding protein [Oscillospiraceae bacterium]|nr:AMP-binding protein [Oscillospiraceae bacterium]HPF55508.1 AMP-binding protein [Clostridiales bacterium]HPK34770.1 AMP-binding protein [Oscillospiraceae bacterium]HPR76130.1 AMP-binding protein [Oscillospiraceae bacterium]